MSKDIRVYTFTHKNFVLHESADPDLYLALHVGRALSDDLGYPGDDTGDSISERNKSFCELTGLYWIWKNVKCDIVGTAHYRRFLINVEKNSILGREEIEEWLEQYDMLLSVACYSEEKSVYEDYKSYHHIDDLEVCRQVLVEKHPEMAGAFDLGMGSCLFSGGNLFITSKEIFDKYCEWLFDILFEVEKRVDISGYDYYQTRLFGFLSERLIRVFGLANTYRIKEVRVGEVQ